MRQRIHRQVADCRDWHVLKPLGLHPPATHQRASKKLDYQGLIFHRRTYKPANFALKTDGELIVSKSAPNLRGLMKCEHPQTRRKTTTRCLGVLPSQP